MLPTGYDMELWCVAQGIDPLSPIVAGHFYYESLLDPEAMKAL